MKLGFTEPKFKKQEPNRRGSRRQNPEDRRARTQGLEAQEADTREEQESLDVD
jgi:hypothetical protein